MSDDLRRDVEFLAWMVAHLATECGVGDGLAAYEAGKIAARLCRTRQKVEPPAPDDPDEPELSFPEPEPVLRARVWRHAASLAKCPHQSGDSCPWDPDEHAVASWMMWADGELRRLRGE